MCAALLIWMKRNDLFSTFGLCKGSVSLSKLLWYIPLAALISSNLWFGLRWNLSVHETFLYIGSMICVKMTKLLAPSTRETSQISREMPRK